MTPDPHPIDDTTLRAWASEDIADSDSLGPPLAIWIHRYWQTHGHGPTWHETAVQLRPDLTDMSTRAIRTPYTTSVMAAYRHQGWIWYNDQPRSLTPWTKTLLAVFYDRPGRLGYRGPVRKRPNPGPAPLGRCKAS